MAQQAAIGPLTRKAAKILMRRGAKLKRTCEKACRNKQEGVDKEKMRYFKVKKKRQTTSAKKSKRVWRTQKKERRQVPAPGLEPGPRERRDFKSRMSTNFIIRVSRSGAAAAVSFGDSRSVGVRVEIVAELQGLKKGMEESRIREQKKQ